MNESLPEALIALAFLTVMEIVLGIDNVVFISITTARLPAEQQRRARFVGLILAMGIRILLLLAIAWLQKLKDPVFSIPYLGQLREWLHAHEATNGVSWRDLIMLGGGMFLIQSAVREIHHKMEPDTHGTAGQAGQASFSSVIAQIVALDVVFSLDSVLTAIGMAEAQWVMIAAIVCAVGVMMFAAGPISDFVDHHPTTKMLALAFLLLIGVMLTAEGFGTEIRKGYIYFAMFFSLMVELLNLRAAAKRAKAAAGH